MKISDIHIDGFGVWHDLTLRRVSSELTVFYGPNEAGKSTLMNFLRTVLYGVTPERRRRYMPPLAGGRPGGWLRVAGEQGEFKIARYADRSPEDVGKVTITTADGQEHGDRLLLDTLEHVDEQTYVNIFAVGLREVQELNSLSDTAAAQWLYRLTSGLDRVSLYDVIHMLGRSRTRLIGPAEAPSEVRTLLAKRDQLRGELDELVVKGRRWAQSAVKLREIADEVDHRQAVSKDLAARARRLEIAIHLKPLWTKRDKLDDQLERFAGLAPLETGTLDQLEELNEKVEDHQRQRDILKGQRQQLRDEAQRLGINDLLVRSGMRLEALAEQQEWLISLEKQVEDLADEVKLLETRLESENERLAHEWTGAGSLPPAITSELVEQLAPQVRAIESTEELLAAAKHELEHRRTGEHHFRTQIESAMAGGDKLGLPMTVDEAGDLVARLRRRLQVEQRIEKAREQAEQVRDQSRELLDEQVVPTGLFSWLLATFVIGFVLMAAWYLTRGTELGQYAGWFAGIGLVAAIFAWLFKHFVEESASDRLAECHHQLELLGKQLRDSEEERQDLDRELPLTEGSVQMRLEHAQRHMAELERVLPVESKRREAAAEISAAERRLELGNEKHAAALANWKNKLRALGLPGEVLPSDLATMAGQNAQIEQLREKIENRREDAERRERELEAVTRRIVALAEETGLREEKASAIEQLGHLLLEYRQQQQRVAQRDSIRQRAKALKAEVIKHAQATIGYRRRRATLFQKCGVDDERGLRQLADRLAEADSLRKQRGDATREIAAAIGKHGSEADFAPLLAPDTIGRLESDWESLSAQGETIDRQLKELLQQRGAQVEQQRAAAADQSLAKKQLELDVVDAQIVEKVEAWRERAAIGVLLEEIRDEYEKFRQPETLREASVYMAKLTSGKYKRIWTPLANDILLVDTEEGDSLPVDVLSRGTREQLFVSLRLALVAAFGRRGIKLPMILDDVFVNFDAGRTKIAVSVLREFAREGHQLMVFTCHEHVWRLFADVQADTRRIPDRFNDNQEIQIEEVVAPESEPQLPEPVVELPAPEPEPEPEPEVVASEPALVEEVVEEFVTEFEPEPEPVARELDEVEYWWHDSAVNGSTNGAAMARKIKKASTNGHHGTAVETEVETWPVEPMIHRPDWW
jgi:uncharacterized protein YhaN